MRRCGLISSVLLFVGITVNAQASPVWQTGETIRSTLFQAQRVLFAAARTENPSQVYAEAEGLLAEALALYEAHFQPSAHTLVPEADAAVSAAFASAQAALTAQNPAALAAARGRVWTHLLWLSYQMTLRALERGDVPMAQAWLPLREYRQATSVTMVDSPAARALRAVERGDFTLNEAALIVGNDLRDAYYFRLRRALSELDEASAAGFVTRAAEWAGQLQGYFSILRTDYTTKLGEASAVAMFQTLIDLETAVLNEDRIVVEAALGELRKLLLSYQPVEFSPDLIAERGRLLYLFLDLVYIEYRDGVRDGQITIPIEYQEATTFLVQARSIYEELRPVIAAADLAAAERLDELLDEIDATMRDLGDSAQVQIAVAESLNLVQSALHIDANTGDATAAFTVVGTLLDEILVAVETGRYADAERTRIEAYGLFESGPELRLTNRAPLLSRAIEGLFWEGSGGQLGLYTLIDRQADAETIASTITILRGKLGEAEAFLGAALTTPVAMLNSAVIILREGLEAVLIIGAILAYMVKTGALSRFIRWVTAGVIGALVLSVATWFAAETFLTITPVQRELIEGVTSLIAMAVLFYVTNWLFHKVYVVDWMKFVREQADKALNNGRAFGLAALGFTVVYREGLETVLFYQALLFDAEPTAVLAGFLVGLVFILVIAYAILRLSKRLPLKLLFTVTTILLLILAFSFTGVGVRELQEAGVVHTMLLPWFPENVLLMELFGLFPTLETVLAQGLFTALIALTFVYSRWQGRRETVAAAQMS
jgi:high-affinity iron transporter